MLRLFWFCVPRNGVAVAVVPDIADVAVPDIAVVAVAVVPDIAILADIC
jgi:hypothetical protein